MKELIASLEKLKNEDGNVYFQNGVQSIIDKIAALDAAAIISINPEEIKRYGDHQQRCLPLIYGAGIRESCYIIARWIQAKGGK